MMIFAAVLLQARLNAALACAPHARRRKREGMEVALFSPRHYA
jgi:hypothetical protein